MQPLIAVVSCHRNVIATAAQRATWGSGLNTRYFYGRGAKRYTLKDEVFLDVPDDYQNLPYKVRAIAQWALHNHYTHLFKCDDDVYVDVNRLMESGFDSAHYIGNTFGQSFCHGGAGYWLSARAMSEIVSSPVNGVSEDGWVANTLAKKGILPTADTRYTYTRRVHGDPLPTLPLATNELITVAEFSPEEMQLIHRKRNADPTDAMSADEYRKYVWGR